MEEKIQNQENDDTNLKCDHEFIAKEFPSQSYGTCLCCGSTIFEN